MTEHQCDTCKNEQCPLFAKSGYKPTGNTEQYYSIRWVIGKVGCASHSSRPAPAAQQHDAAIRKDERGRWYCFTEEEYDQLLDLAKTSREIDILNAAYSRKQESLREGAP